MKRTNSKIQNAQSLATPGVRGLSPYIPGRNADQLRDEFGVDHWIQLASNENPLGPSPRVVRALNEFDASLGRYPDGGGTRLRTVIAEHHTRANPDDSNADHHESHSSIEPQQITLGNGSDDILALIGRVFADASASVVYSQHCFAMYPIVTQSVGATAIEVPALNYGHDLPAMLAAIQPDTRLVFIANPNNPTGTCVFDSALREFLSALPDEVIVVMDQAYAEYIDHAEYSDCTAWINDYPNLIVTRTFSKIHGLAGLRCGYAVSSLAVADLLNRVRGPFNVNTLALRAAEIAIADIQHIDACRQANNNGMQQLVDGVQKIGLGCVPSLGNFLLVDVKQEALAIFERLLQQGIVVRPVANYGLPNHLRITVGTADENDAVLAALQHTINNPIHAGT